MLDKSLNHQPDEKPPLADAELLQDGLSRFVHLMESGLARAVEQADTGILVTGPDGIIQYANAAAIRTTGYSADELIGVNPRILKSGLQDAAIFKDLWSTIQSGDVWRGDLVNRRKDGTVYTAKMTVSPVTDSSGKTIGYIALSEDVSQLRAAQQAQRLLESIVESSQDAIIASSLDGTIVSWNGAAEQLYGYSESEIIGQPIRLLVAPEEWSNLAENRAKIARGERLSHFEGIGMTKGGARVDISVSLAATTDQTGHPTGQAAIIRDITERKAADRALRASEGHYRRLFECNLAGVLRTTAQGSILDCNQALAKSLGYTRDEFRQNTIDQFFYDPNDRTAIMERLRLEGSVTNAEIRFRNKDGEPVYMLANLVLLEGVEDEDCDIEGTLIDITERKRFEQDLIAAGERAQAGDRAKSEFLVNMSHELRTPLNGILGVLDLLSDSVTAKEEREYLDIAKQSAESLLETIQQILDITSLDHNKLELKSSVFHLAGEMQGALETLATGAKAKDIEFTWRIDSRIPRLLKGDPLRLRQILMNIVGNAIKFTERGEVSVALTKLSQCEEGVEIECIVTDTGIGIPKDKLQTMFEVFGKADTSLSRRHGGVGLGLPIALRLIRMMHGDIRFESKVGQGTKARFSVRLELPVDGTAALRRPAIPLTVPRNWPAFQRHLDSNSVVVEITPDIHCATSSTGRIWSASEGFLRVVSNIPLETGTTLQLAFGESRRVKGEVVFCQQWPNGFNLGIQIMHDNRFRREPRFPVEAKGVLTILGDDGPCKAPVDIVDVSGSGLGILCCSLLSPGTCAEIETSAAIIFGEVRYSDQIQEQKFRCGIKMYQLIDQHIPQNRTLTGLFKRLTGIRRSS